MRRAWIALVVLGLSCSEPPKAPPPVRLAVTAVETEVDEGAPLRLEAKLTGAVGSYEVRWDFGDGASATGSLRALHAWADDGDATVTVKVTSGTEELASSSMTVRVRNVSPRIDLPPAHEWVPERPFALQVPVFDPGEDALTATIDWGDGAVETRSAREMAGRAIRGQHIFATEGLYSIKLDVTDDDGAASAATLAVRVFRHQILTLDVQLPSWTPVGTAVIGRATAADLDGKPLTLKLDKAPTGMTLGSNGALEWTPGPADVGAHAILVSATDGVVTTARSRSIAVSGFTVQAEAKINAAAGGVIEVTDPASPLKGALLEIPAGALAADTTLQMALLGTPPPGDQGVGPAVELLPSGIGFLKPVKLTLPIDTSALPADFPREAVQIETWAWVALEGGQEGWHAPGGRTLKADGSAVSALLHHFTPYQIRRVTSTTPVFTWLTFMPTIETDHFFIQWSKEGPDAPLSDIGYFAAKNKGTFSKTTFRFQGGDYRDDGVPFYVQDLADFLEDSYRVFQERGYRVRGPPENKYLVTLKKLSDDGRLKGLAYPGTNVIELDSRNNDSLGGTAAHELFHHCQFDAMGDSYLSRKLANSKLYVVNRADWIVEATAEEIAAERYTGVQTNSDYLLSTQVMGRSLIFGLKNNGYEAFPVFKFAKKRLGVDLSHRFWSIATREMAGIGLENGTGFFYRRLREISGQSTPRIWTDFALAFQYSRSPNWLLDAYKMGFESMGKPLRSLVPDSNLLTGKERAQPVSSAGEVGPRRLQGLIVPASDYTLRPGQVVSFAMNPACDPDVAKRPCAGRLAALPDAEAWVIVFRPKVLIPDRALRGAVYRMPLAAPPPADAEPILLAEFSTLQTEVEVPLTALDGQQFDQLVVSFVNDPEEPPQLFSAQPLALDVFFRKKCRTFVEAGYDSTCALRADGTVWCWGYNLFGEVGDGTQVQRELPTQVRGLPPIRQLSVGLIQAVCALDQIGGVWCWGWNDDGVIGLHPDQAFVVTRPRRVFEGAIQVDVGESHACAVTPSGDVYCWGWNEYGQLGGGVVNEWNTLGSITPIKVLGVSDAVHVMAAATHSCAVTRSGAVKCWGSTYSGQLGNEEISEALPFGIPSAVPVSGLGGHDGPVRLTGSRDQSCAALGRADFTDRGRPDGGSDAGTEGRVVCWGGNSQGELGGGFVTPAPDFAVARPVTVLDTSLRPLADITQIASSGWSFSTAARRRDGRAFVWGGVWGNLARPLPLSRPIAQVSTGQQTLCVSFDDGAVWCHGRNDHGQLGDGTTFSRQWFAPVLLAPGCQP